MNFGNKLLQDEKTTSVKMLESLSYFTDNELFFLVFTITLNTDGSSSSHRRERDL